MADVKLRLEIDPTAQTESDRYYEIDKFNGLKSVSSTSQSVTDGSSIQYGILPNTGSAKVVDVNGKLADLIRSGNLADHDVNCDLFLNGNKIQHHLTADSDYYEDKVLTMNFKDSLAQLSERDFSGMPLTEQSTAFGVLSYVFYKMGGYPLENVGMWSICLGLEKFSSINGFSNNITVKTASNASGGAPIIGFPVLCNHEEQQTISINYTMGAYTPRSEGNGVKLQVFNSYPSSQNASPFASTTLTTDAVSNEDIVFTFTSPLHGTPIFVVNFGGAANDQTITMTINSISLNGKTITSFLQNEIIMNNNQVGTIKQHLDSIKINYPHLDKCSFQEAINKICEIAQLNCIEDVDGNIKFISARPISNDKWKAIHVPRYAQETFPRDSLFVKNKVNNVKLQYDETLRTSNVLYNISLDPQDMSGPIDFDNYYVNESWPWAYKDKSISSSAVQDLYFVGLGQYVRYAFFSITVNGTISNLSGASLEIERVDFNDNYSRTIKFPASFTSLDSDTVFVSSYDDFISKFFQLDGLYYKLKSDYFEYTSSVHRTFDVYGIMPMDGTSFKIFAYIYLGYIDEAGTPHYEFDKNYKLKVSAPSLSMAESPTIETTKFDYEIPSNELNQLNTTYNETPIAEVIADNILRDYKFGIKSTEVRVKLMDFKNESGSYSLDYESGEIPNVGDCVIVDSDNFGTSAFTYPDGTEVTWKVVGRQFDYSGVPTMVLQLQQVVNLFAQLSWSEINFIAQSGDSEKYFSIGDKKTVELTDGSKIVVKIARINEDTIIDANSNNGTAGLTIIADTLLPGKRAMNASGNVSWADSELRAWLNSANGGYALLPSEIYNIVETRSNTQRKQLTSPQYETTYDKLWVPISTEIEGTALDRVKKDTSGQPYWYWLRDRYANMLSYNSFRAVKDDGSISYANRADLNGIRLGFCVGNIQTSQT